MPTLLVSAITAYHKTNLAPKLGSQLPKVFKGRHVVLFNSPIRFPVSPVRRAHGRGYAPLRPAAGLRPLARGRNRCLS